MRKVIEGSWNQAIRNGIYSGLCIAIAYILLLFLQGLNIKTDLHLGYNFKYIFMPMFVMMIGPVIISILVTVFFLNFRKNKYLCAYLPVSVTVFVLVFIFGADAVLNASGSDLEGKIFFIGSMLYIYGPIGHMLGTITSIVVNILSYKKQSNPPAENSP